MVYVSNIQEYVNVAMLEVFSSLKLQVDALTCGHASRIPDINT